MRLETETVHKPRLAREKPSLMHALLLKCPYCGEHELRQRGSWFEFQSGCPRCSYRYEREEGYFTSASWMISFPTTATLAVVLAVVLMISDFGLSAMNISALLAALITGCGLLSFPYAQAIWMVIDHRIHPLSSEDYWDPNSE